MIALSEAKILGLKRLKDSFEKKHSSRYAHFSLDLLPLTLAQLVPYLQETPLFYWKSKDDSCEFLSIGKIATFQNLSQLLKLPLIFKENKELLIFGGQRFDPQKEMGPEWRNFGDYAYFLPAITFERKKDRTILHFFFKTSLSPQQRAHHLFYVEKLLDFKRPHNDADFSFKHLYEHSQKESWIRSLKCCLEKLNNKEIDKVVMARKELYQSEELLDANSLFEKIIPKANKSYLIYYKLSPFYAFISLTPERLFKIENKTLYTEAIAGTTHRDKDSCLDQKLANDLLNDPKELSEHRMVYEELVSKLSRFCSDVKFKSKETVLKLSHVQHIISTLEAILESNNTFEILHALHPTPAVGGRPWNIAKEIIRQHEGMDRGLYAAPIGFFGHNQSEFAVGIRSALVDFKKLHLYGGAGIVKDSGPEKEWLETEKKLENFSFLFNKGEKTL